MKITLRKILPTLLMTIVMVSMLILPQITVAQFAGLDEINQQTGLPSEKDFLPRGTSPGNDMGINRLEGLLLTVVDLVKYLIYGIAIFLLVFQGFKLIIAGKDIDTFSEEAKKNAKYSLMAILIVFVTDTAIRKVFFPESGAIFENNGANIQLYGEAGIVQIRSIYNIMAYLSGAIALATIIFSGVGMALSAGSEEGFKKHKNRILWALAGLLLVGVAEFVVKDVLFPDIGTKLPNISKGMLLLKSFTNFMAGFVTTISFGVMLYGGFLYVVGGVSEDSLGKAKKAIVGGIVGILLSAAAFGLATTLIQADSSGTVIAPVGQAPAGIPSVASPTK